jgi:vacuolar protein sorting-associated protein 35
VRLQTQGQAKDKKKREKERLDLRILVGANLVRLSQLDGLDVNDYKSTVLPTVLEEVISCKDTIAQNYLMDCIIQVFPDEYHVATLDKFLETCTQLKEKVNVRLILESMMERLASNVARTGQAIPGTVNAFKLFNDCNTSIIENRANMSLTESLKLLTGLINFSLKCYPTRIDYVTHCLTACSALIDKTDFVETSRKEMQHQEGRSNNETTVQIEALLSAPLSILALRVLEIPAYGKLMSYLPWGNWKELALNFLRSVIARNTPLSEPEQVEQLFNAITPLLRDRDGAAPLVDEEGRELPASPAFVEEQHLVAKVVHLMKNEDTDTLLKVYVVARKSFTNGGNARIKHCLPPLVIGSLSLVRRVLQREKQAEADSNSAPQFSTRKVFHFVIEVITAMATSFPELALGLFLLAAQSADQCMFHAIAYEFFKEALLIYESDISESKAQVRCLTSVIGTLLNCNCFPNEEYETLITKVAQYANKLLKKPDQSRMVTLCSHLFAPKMVNADGSLVERYADPDRVLECLQRALKIASVSNTNLFVEILDR